MSEKDLEQFAEGMVPNVRGVLHTVADTEPDEEAKKIQTAKRLKVPLSLVPKSKGDQRRVAFQTNDLLSDLPRHSPHTALFLENPDNAKVAHDDIENLSGIERVFTEYGRKPLARVINKAGKLVDIAAFPFAMAADAAMGRDVFKKILASRVEQFESQDVAAAPAKDTSFAGRLTQSLEELIPVIATGPFAPFLIAGEATTEKGLELSGKGVKGPALTGTAAVSGATAFAMTKIPMSAKTYAGAIARGAVSNVGLGAVERGTEKGILAAGGYDEQAKEVNIFDEKSIAMDLALGIVFGGVQHYHEAKAAHTKETIQNIVDTVQKSKLKERLPDRLKEFIRVAKGDVKSVFMPTEKFEEMVAATGKPIEEILSKPDDYAERKAQGMDMEVPIEDLSGISEHVAPEHIDNMTLHPADVPASEIPKSDGKAAEDLAKTVETAPAAEQLRPSVRVNGEQYDGEPGQKHDDVLAAHGLESGGEERGFVGPDGEFMTRRQAKSWVKKNDPDTYGRLPKKEAMHSEPYANAYEAGKIKPGPGAQTASSKKETPSDITQLSAVLDTITTPETSPATRIDLGTKIADMKSGAKTQANKVIDTFRGLTAALWNSYRHLPAWTDFKDMLGRYQGERQKTSFEVWQFAKKIQQNLPREFQEGITNWIEAEGNDGVLNERIVATADPKLRAGYEAALKLTDEQKNFARNVVSYFEAKLELAQELGILDSGVENYVMHIWDKENPFTRMIKAEVNAGMFRQNPKLAKQRVLETFFKGEQLGLIPKDKRIGFLLSAYDDAINEAISARTFIKSLLHGNAQDGRPLAAVSGYGKPIETGKIADTGTGEVKGFVIKPRSKPEDTGDYMPLDHPALRKWKWATADSVGKPIMLEGDILLHPEIFRHMKNILGRSAIRDWEVGGVRPGALVITGAQELKSTLLSLSLFHQVQEGVHSVAHEVNPFGARKIDFDDPATSELIRHGLMVFNHRGLQEFSEGLHARGLVNRLIDPITRGMATKYGEYLFQDYIPRLKVEMAMQAVERNTKRYSGKLSKDQILELSAKEANAAFGELNYTMIGRNKTMQDVFRLACLAPDFLEARMKFVGQALRPYGREQSAALLRLSLIMAATAQITNYAVNGQMDWSRPFSIKIGRKYYTLRSIPGDIIHLFTDWRSFTYHRLNPTVMRPIIEGLTGRDQFGRKRDIPAQAVDWIKYHAPISVQGPLFKQQTLLDTILSSMGIGVSKKK